MAQKAIVCLIEPSDEANIPFGQRFSAKRVETDYSHRITNKLAMGENKTAYGEGEVKSLHLFDPIPSLGFRVHFFHFKRVSSIAQEESRTISENVKWGKKESYKKGNVSFAYSRFLGYKKEDGKIVIDKEQAVVVKQIYQWYLRDGLTLTAIAQRLNENSVKTPGGKNNWTVNNITSILTNEKYKGHAILQKTYCDNFLTHQMKKNNGQMPKYHVEDSHPAIIDEDTWNEVQLEIQRRREIGSCYSSTDVFSGKLICADCGSFMEQRYGIPRASTLELFINATISSSINAKLHTWK